MFLGSGEREHTTLRLALVVYFGAFFGDQVVTQAAKFKNACSLCAFRRDALEGALQCSSVRSAQREQIINYKADLAI